MAENSSGRIPQLDGLRAIAISMVLVSHFWTYPANATALNRLFSSGWLGVDLFFVLSGYLITSILLRTRDSATYFRTFYMRRILRIFPPYYLLLLIVLVLLPLARPLGGELAAEQWTFWLFLGNFFLAHGWQMLRIDLTWSLAIEEQFYLVWPALVRYCNRIGPVCIAICIGLPIVRVALWESGVGWMWLHLMMPLRADSFAWGALVALYPRRFAALSLLAIPIGGLCAIKQYDQPLMLVGTIGYSLTAACSAGLISLALRDGRFARALSLRPARYLGEVSYGVYLYHPVCLLIVTSAVKFGHTTTGGIARIVVLSIVSVGVAALSYRFFEQPILRLKTRLPVARQAPALEST